MKYSLNDVKTTDQITKTLQKAVKLVGNDKARTDDIEECIEDLKTLVKKLESFDEYESEKDKEYIHDMKSRARNYNSQLQRIIALVNNTESSKINSSKNTTLSFSEKTTPKTTVTSKEISNKELGKALTMLKTEIANNINYDNKDLIKEYDAKIDELRRSLNVWYESAFVNQTNLSFAADMNADLMSLKELIHDRNYQFRDELLKNELLTSAKSNPQKKPVSTETSGKETKAKVQHSKPANPSTSTSTSTSTATRDNFIEPKKSKTATSPRVEDTKSTSSASLKARRKGI